MTKKRRKELRSVEEFEKELREEISVSVEFDLPLTIVLALNIKGGWKQGALRRPLDVLRVADLATRPGPEDRRPGGRGETARGGSGGNHRRRDLQGGRLSR
jgi:hypothetical protein